MIVFLAGLLVESAGLAVFSRVAGDPIPLPFVEPRRDLCPSCASRSRKSLHSSASPSLLVGLPIPPSPDVGGTEDPVPPVGANALLIGFKLAVDDALLNGVLRGTLRLVDVDAPGRANPAASFCSEDVVSSVFSLPQ